MLYLDLDEFKSVNDKLGHGAGDELLVQVASRLRSYARVSDSVARLGGDEFAIIANGINNSEEALALAERLVETFSLPFIIDGSEVYNTVSIGIAMAPSAGVSSDILLKNADIALYRAKSEIDGSVQIFEPQHDTKARERRAIEHDLRLALARDEFFLLFQPFFDLAENRLTGCEALLRWRHPLRGIIFPEKFIQIAEATELVHPIGEWVIREACRAASKSVPKLQQGLQSFRNMRRMEASFKNARALQLRFSQSLARRRQRLSHAIVRSTIQRLGNCTNPFAWSDRLTISVSRRGRNLASALAKIGPWYALSANSFSRNGN